MMVINSARTMDEVLDRGLGEAQDIDGRDEQTSGSPTDRCHCDNLPPEVLAQILELVVVSTWKDGPCSAPNAAQTSTFPIGGSGGAEIASAGACGGQKIVYPKLFLVVCKRWCSISLVTPSLWSYLWIGDDSTVDDISLSLKRSGHSPLSIRFNYLSQKTEIDDLRSKVEEMDIQCSLLYNRLGSRPEPATEMVYEGRSGLKQLDNKLSLLVQNFERWRRFLFTAVQLRYIQHAASVVTTWGKLHRNPFLEYRLRLKLRDTMEIYIDLSRTSVGSWFDNPMPFLQKLSLSRGCIPDMFWPNTVSNLSIPEAFPVLRELDAHHLSGRLLSHFLGALDGVPQLRVLRLFHGQGKEQEPFRGFSTPLVVLDALEEITVQDSDWSTLTRTFNVISTPNVSSLFIVRTGIINLFAQAVQRLSIFANVRMLTLKGVWLEEAYFLFDLGGKQRLQCVVSLFSAMPEVTVMHLDSVPWFFLEPLIRSRSQTTGTNTEGHQLPDNPLLPNLKEIYFSAFNGDEIVSVVSGRRELGAPVKTLRINKSSILSGVVSYEHWENLRSQVEKLSWFEEDADSD